MIQAQAFEALVLQAFSALMEEYDLSHEYTRVVATDYYLALRGRQLRIKVSYEVYARPWVVLEQLDSRSGEAIDSSSLEWLLVHCRVPSTEGNVPRDESALLQVLEEKASLLKEHGGEILSGSFAVFPELHRIANEHIRRASADLHGR